MLKEQHEAEKKQHDDQQGGSPSAGKMMRNFKTPKMPNVKMP